MNELWAQSSKQAANLKPKPRFFSGAGFVIDIAKSSSISFGIIMIAYYDIKEGS